LLPSDLPGLQVLTDAVAAHKGGEALSEEARLDLQALGDGLVAESRGRVVGCASLRHDAGRVVIELAVDPGGAAEVTQRLLDGALERAQGGPVWLWCTDEETLAAGRARGLRLLRRLLELECGLPVDQPGGRPEGIEIRTLSAGDIPAFLAVNNAAFSGTAAWTEGDVAARMRRSWFDARGVFLAWESERAVGTAWTKMHRGGVGEIYLLAVHPEAQGRSVGRALALAALEHVYGVRGATRGLAYTDEKNHRARRLYAGLGFKTVRVKDCLEG
jgi:mycothiol synthase